MNLARMTVFTGPMCSGKTSRLFREIDHAVALDRAAARDQSFCVVKPKLDTRSNGLQTHDDRAYPAVSIETPRSLLPLIAPNTRCVFIDEVQFFDRTIIDVTTFVLDEGVSVIVAGLDLDYQRQPFGWMHELMSRADEVEKLKARCGKCSAPAMFTSRIGGGSSLVLVGDHHYEPRCRACWA